MKENVRTNLIKVFTHLQTCRKKKTGTNRPSQNQHQNGKTLASKIEQQKFFGRIFFVNLCFSLSTEPVGPIIGITV